MGSSLFAGTEERALTAEENRMLNSLSDGSRNLYSNHRYFACDVDNDGMVEYGHADYRSYLDVTFYEKENGEFRVISLEEVLHDLNPDRDSTAEAFVKTAALRQLWCEKLGDVTYLFTVEELAYSPDYILRIRVLKDDYVEDKAQGGYGGSLPGLGFIRDYAGRRGCGVIVRFSAYCNLPDDCV